MTNHRLALAAVFIAVVAAYAIALPGPYQFDDYATIAIDPGAASLAAWWADVTRHVRPLTKASFAITAALGQALGNVPLGHRIGNVAIHLGCMALFVALARQIGASFGAALLAALLFGLHPFATEAVTYLSGRSIALGTLLALASLVAWNRGWVVVSLAAFAAAVLARETVAVTLPLLVLAWSWARSPRPRDAIVEAMPFVAIAAMAAAWLLLNARYAELLFLSRRIADVHSGDASLLTALGYFAEGFFLLRYPNIDPAIAAGGWTIAARAAGTAIVVAAFVLAWRVRERRPHWLIGLAWAFLWLAPIYALPIRHDAVAERHFYPALWGCAYPFAVELAAAFERPFARAAGAIIVATLFAFTTVRNADYVSEIALWEAAVRGAPQNARAQYNLGYAYMEAQRWKESVAALTRAAALEPHDSQIRWRLRAARARDAELLRAPAFIDER